MNRRGFQIGPGAASLLLIVVVLTMSALGMLTLMNARSDAELSARSAQVAQEVATLDAAAEEALAALDATLCALAPQAADNEAYLALLSGQLPEGMTLEGSVVSWRQRGTGIKSLACGVEIAPLGSFPRCVFVEHRLLSGIDEEESEQWN